ncbi:MAG: D-Ala-D-Ala carboxypeptidase family metallohydrolase [Bacteroidia bacterium]
MISKHISLQEATESATALRMGIKNVPNELELEAMKYVAENLFEPIREWYDKPININSFFRCVALNKAVKGSVTSGHVLGNSIDISAGKKAENKKIFDFIKLSALDYDQVINEYDYSWIHISLKKDKNRKQILTIK